jgi:1-acyl-sn-glycerol-3-phosphate acyltransferase
MMRFFYLLLFFSLRITIPIYFRRRKTVNSPKSFFGRTIYVSNHASSFMDPLVVASMRRPIVFFMTRSDVFKPFLKPILWASHMLPIYRQLDGEDTVAKNNAVFHTCTKILSFGRNLLIFGEGFTDDVFVRRLKPVKKGAIRIGFTALETMQWKKKVYLAAVGCNYSDPNEIQSDVLVATSDKICLNDYKEAYLENPNKTITELTKKLEIIMREQITHVENKDNCNFHEGIMRLTRKGMNAKDADHSIPLEKRWRYAQNLANWLNSKDLEEEKALNQLKTEVESYFGLLQKMKLEERFVYFKASKSNGSTWNEKLYLFTMWPFALLGLIHCYIPYKITKGFVEKSFKRRVFWSSVKMLMGKLITGLMNIPFIFLFYYFIYPNVLLALFYFLIIIPKLGLCSYIYFQKLKDLKTKEKINQGNIEKIIKKRTELLEKIESLVPVA